MKKSKVVFLKPKEGRTYSMGPMTSVFKADLGETSKYSISEWWLKPHTKGPGEHSHSEDDVFYVLEGTVHIFIKDKWQKAAKGSFVLIPGGTLHDFENRSAKKVGLLNFSIPGGFEKHMPSIVDWFKERPLGKA